MFKALKNVLARVSAPMDARSGQDSLGDCANQDTQPPPCPSGQIQGSISMNCQTQRDAPAYAAERQGLSKEGCDGMHPCILPVLLDSPDDFKAERKEFLRIFGDGYGYHGQLQSIRHEEFRRLAGQVYLDYAGAALYSERQIQACSDELLTTLLCNPHSAPASASADAMSALRRNTLELLNADGRQYEVVITSGATAALKMVAECFPWSAGASCLAHPAAVHNSVLGMRGPALAVGAAVQLVQLTAAVPTTSGQPTEQADSRQLHQTEPAAEASATGDPRACQVQVVAHGAPIFADVGRSGGRDGGGGGGDGSAAAAGPGPWNLLVLPVECNFTGDRQHLVEAVRNVQLYGIGAATAATSVKSSAVEEAAGDGGGPSGRYGTGRWLVLLDAAKACATAPPDLSTVPADFVVFSFYKIFGYPTGLGALVARKDALALLAAGKSYFGGGTVEVAVADRPYYVRRQAAPGFEDGTPPFTSIAAARHGFAFLHRLGGLAAVHRHSCYLARWLATRLEALRHANGTPVCVLYGRWCAAANAAALTAIGVRDADHGPTVSFNLLRPDGSWVGYAEVGRLAAMHGLVLRTGCFCNPGACAEWLGLSAEDFIRHHSAGHVCWDDHDLADGRPTGAVRVSLGAVSTFEDVYVVLQLIRRYFVQDGGGDGNGAHSEKLSAVSSLALSTTKATEGSMASSASGPADAAVAEAEREQLLVQHTAAQAPPQHQTPSTSWPVPTEEITSRPAATPAVVSPTPTFCGQNTRPSIPSISTAVLQKDAGGASRRSCSTSSNFGVDQVAHGGVGGPPLAAGPHLSRILLYPVKSCAAQVVEAWPIGPTGLLYDREWALVDDGGKVLTLKQCPRMALVRPLVDLTRGTLTIHAPHDTCMPPLELAIPGLFHRGRRGCQGQNGTGASAAELVSGNQDVAAAAAARGSELQQPRTAAVRHYRDAVRLDAGLTMERFQVCGDTVCSDLVDVCHDSASGTRVRQWFGRALGAPCRIVQQCTGTRKVRRPAGPEVLTSSSSASASAASRDKTEADPQPQQQQHQQYGLPDASGGGADGAGDGAAAAREGRGIAAGEEPSVGFANDGQYLLVSEASMNDLRARLRQQESRSGASSGAPALTAPTSTTAAAASSASADCGSGNGRGSVNEAAEDDLVARLRPNLVVSGFQPYEEDGWAAVHVGPLHADVLGTCPRCELLQVDPRVGVRRGAEVLVALAQYRRRGGRVQFGVLLAAAASAAKSEPDVEAAVGPGAADTEAKRTGMGVREQAAGGEGGGSGVAGGDWADWLRWEFGRYLVIAVGDPVLPTSATAAVSVAR